MLLTLYFAFSTLVAPWLCCCTFTATRTPASETAAVEDCCCCKEKSKSDSTPRELPTKHECPCRAEGQPVAVVAKSTTIRSNPETSSAAIAPLDVMPSVMVLTVAVAINDRPPPLDVHARLSLFCKLLC